jgi:hypothetical protein
MTTYPYSAQPENRYCFSNVASRGDVCPTFPCIHTKCKDEDYLEQDKFSLAAPFLDSIISEGIYSPELFVRARYAISDADWEKVQAGVQCHHGIEAKPDLIEAEIKEHKIWEDNERQRLFDC